MPLLVVFLDYGIMEQNKRYHHFFPQLDISYDKFIRTTDPSHEVVVKEFYSRVLKNGDIYRADYEGLYCINCEEYKVFHILVSILKHGLPYSLSLSNAFRNLWMQ